MSQGTPLSGSEVHDPAATSSGEAAELHNSARAAKANIGADAPDESATGRGTEVHRTVRAGLALCVLAAGAAAVVGAALASARLRAPRPSEVPSGAVVAIERDGLRYQFNPLTGREYLFDRDASPDERRDLGRDRPLDLERLRRLLAEELGVPDLGVLHAPHRQTAEALRAMGYL